MRTVACPRCGAPSVYAPQNKWRPFCSERCKMIDLGAWAAERHRLPVEEDKNEPGEEDKNEPGEDDRGSPSSS